MILPEGWDSKNGSRDVLVLLKKEPYRPIWGTAFHWNNSWNLRYEPGSVAVLSRYPGWEVIKWQELPPIDKEA